MPRLSKIGAAALAAFGWTSGSLVSVSYLAVAGGGGQNSDAARGGGGGAGGLLTGTTALNPLLSYTVTVGAGGGLGSNGSGSSFNSIATAGGGYGGAGVAINGNSGGSGGGGGGASTSFGTGSAGNTPSTSPSQGNNGGSGVAYNTGGSFGAGGGGGGAGAVGSAASGTVAGNGGVGVASSITGTSTYYAGGGGGGGGNSANSSGGLGGGGAGAYGGGTPATQVAGTSGTANTGGGSGGSSNYGTTGVTSANGGSGVVIISYPSPQKFGGGIVTVSGGNTIHTFTTSGTLSPLNSLTASSLVVAGGGGGGKRIAGGGGAGGYRTGSGITLDTNSTYLVTVGAGGAGGAVYTVAGTSGNNSVFNDITSAGGGGGAGSSISNGVSGGSGGGSSDAGTAGSGNTPSTSPSQGSNGGVGSGSAPNYGGGGGGGASAVGGSGSSTVAGNGGAGTANSISGTSVTYAGGGGGGSNGGTAGTGGSGGGGNGTSSNATPTDASANLGGGGGGCGGLDTGTGTTFGGAGGSGVVIISYSGSVQLMAGGTVTVSGGNVIHTFTSSGYLTPIVLVNNSLRFRASASAYLNRTPPVASNRKTWTWSGWVKRGLLSGSATYEIFMGDNYSTSFTGIRFINDQIYVQDFSTGTKNIFWITNAVFRDPSSWYHVVVKYDTTQASSTNSVLIYINGVSQTLTFTANTGAYVQNYDGVINSTSIHKIGALSTFNYFDGYMTDINFIDGQALDPFSFGTTSDLGVWQPIRYGGSYGTNGFYLKFTDTTNTTTLGYDSSPNSNNWTTNNISLTAGSTYDSMTDVPTLTSATAANYATFNPVGIVYGGTYPGTCSNANLSFAQSGNASHGFGTMAVPSNASIGIYWEVICTTMDTARTYIGMIDPYTTPAVSANTASYGFPDKAILERNGNYFNLASGTAGGYSGTYTAYVVNDVIMVAYKNGVIWFGKNGTWMNSGNPAAGTGYIDNTIGTTNTWLPYVGYNSNFNINFGQQPFSYTPPTGFVALNTFNLPTPTIGATAATTANEYFDTTLYTGTGATLAVTNSGSMQPDFVWIKTRNQAGYGHELFDSVRGATKYLISNSTGAESTAATSLTSFNSNGFTVGSWGFINDPADTEVAWQWRASNTTAVTNTNGSITSSVSANTSAGFSIVTYTGNSINPSTVGHGLGVAPQFIIIKSRSNAYNWVVGSKAIDGFSSGKQLYLNSTSAVVGGENFFSNTQPTSTVFTVKDNYEVNFSGYTYVAYCWTPIAGFSAFGSYTGNGSTDGPFVFTGFRPRFIMFKLSSGSGSGWLIYDSSRNTYNLTDLYLQANQSNAEAGNSTDNPLDFLSNGFKLRYSNSATNLSGGTFIYMAFAESPLKFSNAR